MDLLLSSRLFLSQQVSLQRAKQSPGPDLPSKSVWSRASERISLSHSPGTQQQGNGKSPGTLAQGLAAGHLQLKLSGPLSGKTPDAESWPVCVWGSGCICMSVYECRGFVFLCVCMCAHISAGMEQTNYHTEIGWREKALRLTHLPWP